MKNNKGINLIALIVTIVVMIILASIAIRVGTDSYENALESKAAAERKEVVSAVSGRFGDYQRNNTASPIVGFKIPEENMTTEENIVEYIKNKLKKDHGKLMTEDELENKTYQNMITKFVDDNFDDMDYTRLLFYRDLIELGIEKTNLNAVYLVNYYSSDVVGPIS